MHSRYIRALHFSN